MIANYTMVYADVPIYLWSKTSVSFQDPQHYRKLSFPATNGMVISSGNLQGIYELGVLVSPVVGFSSSYVVNQRYLNVQNWYKYIYT